MNCSKCGYQMDAWDTVCPRCQGKGIDKPAQPNPTPGQQASAPKAVATPQSAPRSTPAATGDDDDEDNWWQMLGGGVLLWALAGYSYWSFTNWEATGGIRRMKWYIALAYNIGGKWPIVIVLALLGLAGVIFGIMEFRKMNSNS